MSAARLCTVLLALVLVAAGCGEDEGTGAAGGGGTSLDVVATTPVAADLAKNVGGDRVSVTALMAPNTDPHEYEVRPRDVEAVAEAGVLVRSGGDLDDWLQEAIEGSGTEASVLTLIDRVSARRAEGEVDPHWWHDPRNAERAVAAIRDAFAQADPAGASAYRANADAYLAQVRKLDATVQACVERVPANRRKLVTTHDALGYYAARYGIEVIGTVIPSLSTSGQPSAGETAELVNTIRDEGVTTIFAESSIDPRVEQAIAREAGAEVGPELWADSLGPAGSSGDTYLKAEAANTRALVDGFSGGEQSCSLPF
jgi:ABC-type Zn uptake system ZnuABC Zn-binding protein ZnuA